MHVRTISIPKRAVDAATESKVEFFGNIGDIVTGATSIYGVLSGIIVKLTL